jgi:uncharacterized membrane protein YkoI
MNSVNSKTLLFVLLLVIVPTATMATEKISSILFTYIKEHEANAQLNKNNNNDSTGANNTNSTKAKTPLTGYPTTNNYVAVAPSSSENWTGSILTSPTIGQAIASKIHISIANASTIAEKAVGNGSHTVLAMLETDRGFLVYTTWVDDSNYNFNRVIVDPANGKVLFNQPLTLMELEQSRMMLRGILHPNLNMVPSLPPIPPPPAPPSQLLPPLGTSPLPNSGSGGMIIPAPPLTSSPPVTGIIPGRP